MGLKRPGRRSNLQLLITGFWACAMTLVLLGGHIIAAYLMFTSFQGNVGIKILTEMTGLDAWMFWVWMFAAIVLDGWIFYNIRKDRKKALER